METSQNLSLCPNADNSTELKCIEDSSSLNDSASETSSLHGNGDNKKPQMNEDNPTAADHTKEYLSALKATNERTLPYLIKTLFTDDLKKNTDNSSPVLAQQSSQIQELMNIIKDQLALFKDMGSHANTKIKDLETENQDLQKEIKELQQELKVSKKRHFTDSVKIYLPVILMIILFALSYEFYTYYNQNNRLMTELDNKESLIAELKTSTKSSKTFEIETNRLIEQLKEENKELRNRVRDDISAQEWKAFADNTIEELRKENLDLRDRIRDIEATAMSSSISLWFAIAVALVATITTLLFVNR